jgi:hypothetical protein
MPLSVKTIPERSLIWVVGEGVVTDGELARYVQDYLIEGDLRSWDEVFDLSRADLLDLTYAGLSQVAAAAAPTDPEEAPTKIAILVSEALGMGVSRMYQALREGKGGRRVLRIFWDREDLVAWLGLSPGWNPPTA